MIEQLLNNPGESYVKISDTAEFFGDGKIKRYHPDDPRYLIYWREEKKKCMEGLWGKCFTGFRYMPGNLYFYGKFCIIIDTDQKKKLTKKIKPLVQDLEWELAYLSLEARGFSGWELDDEYTSSNEWFDYKENGIPDNPNLNLINLDGTLKKYKEPRKNIKELHDKPLGRALFENEATNIFVLGSRGGGKSYFFSLGCGLYEIVFDGIKFYDYNNIVKGKIEVCVGSGDTDKSGEFVQKMVDCMNEFALNSDLGVWGQQGDNDWTPIPFYKDMNGPINSGNKQKGGWVHKYQKKVKGRWVDGFGTGTRMFHVSYSDKKKGGAEAGAGGRYNWSFIEETGLTSLVQEAWNSNRATVRRNGLQFGIQAFLGTSGNIDLIQPSKEMFCSPKQYNILSFKDIWESTGDIGFFLPAYLTYRQFKDKNGNTDLKKAKEHWLKGYQKAVESKNPKTIRMFCMNYPAIPSHMWVTDKKYLLPFNEAAATEKKLRTNELYKSNAVNIELLWDSSQPRGVNYHINHSPAPFYDFPVRTDRDHLDGGVQIYEHPQVANGVVPNDMYIFVHDPYVSDNMEDGESLGVTYGFLNPKYTAQGYNGNLMVCSYISKPKGGKKEYYETLEKLLAYYGNPVRGLWYEANRGEFCRSYFAKKNKLYLLCLRPQYEKGDSMYQKKIAQYGFIVGNKVAKVSMVDNLHDFLLEDVVINDTSMKMIESIPCIWTQRQIMQFDLDGNFDGVSALLGYPLAVAEQEHEIINKLNKKSNRLSFLSNNRNLKKANSIKQFNKKYYEEELLLGEREAFNETQNMEPVQIPTLFQRI